MVSSSHSRVSKKEIDKKLPIIDNQVDHRVQNTVGNFNRQKLSVKQLIHIQLVNMPNGATYEGEWINGMRDGYGK